MQLDRPSLGCLSPWCIAYAHTWTDSQMNKRHKFQKMNPTIIKTFNKITLKVNAYNAFDVIATAAPSYICL